MLSSTRPSARSAYSWRPESKLGKDRLAELDDTNLPPILTIDSGDIISFPDTWSHFLNEMQPGVSIDTLAKLRVSNPGKGPHPVPYQGVSTISLTSSSR